MGLLELGKGYLDAEGYEVSARGRDLLVGNRKGIAEETEFFYLWVLAGVDPRSLGGREGALLARFKEASDSHPAAPKFLLVESREGLSREFQEGAQRWYNVKIRVPAQLFDTALKSEESPEAASALRELARRGDEIRRRRAEQPFSAENDQTGPDLLPALVERLHTTNRKPIHIVVGPAGMGKTVLFESLFAELYERFIAEKRRQILSPRPLPVLPEHVPQADAPTIRAILRAFLRTEFARPLDARVFEWRLTHGMATWLLDGLDEIIAQDPDFFDYLLELLTLPGGEAPAILICVRDSLLVTHEPLREFCAEFADSVEVYRLQPWGPESKRQFAGFALGPKAQSFLESLRARPSLDTLAATPYYCALLAEEFAENEAALQADHSEVDLVDGAVDRIIDREIKKGLIREDLTPKEEIKAFAEAIAAEDMEEGFRGVLVDEARELAKPVLSGDLDEDALERSVGQMTQLAFFASGGMGRIQFAQELLEQYMLGRWLIGLFSRPESLVRGLGLRHIPPDWLTLRVVSGWVRRENRIASLQSLLLECVGRGVAFKNLLQLTVLAADRPDALKAVPLERQDLSGLVLSGLQLREVSFRGCDLSDVVFARCDLAGADFSDAIISNTAFVDLPEKALQGALMGDLSRFLSARANGKVLRTPGEAREWFEARTKIPGKVVEPCPAALQLRHLFLKFVRPDGTARRSWLDRRALERGARFGDPAATVEAAIRYGYLVPKENRPQHLERPSGDAYSEMIAFASRMEVSRGVRALLDDVCDRDGCPHVPAPGG